MPAAVEQEAPSEVSEVVTSTETMTDTQAVTDTTSTDAAPADAATDEMVEAEPTAELEPAVEVSAPDPALVEAGLAVYHEQYCGVCHTLTAAGTTGDFGPPHDGMGATAAERIASPTYTGAATTPAEYIRESIVTPEVYLVPEFSMTSHHMPVYADLPAADIDALVAFLLAQ